MKPSKNPTLLKFLEESRLPEGASFYQVLGVSENASVEEIDLAYKAIRDARKNKEFAYVSESAALALEGAYYELKERVTAEKAAEQSLPTVHAEEIAAAAPIETRIRTPRPEIAKTKEASSPSTLTMSVDLPEKLPAAISHYLLKGEFQGIPTYSKLLGLDKNASLDDIQAQHKIVRALLNHLVTNPAVDNLRVREAMEAVEESYAAFLARAEKRMNVPASPVESPIAHSPTAQTKKAVKTKNSPKGSASPHGIFSSLAVELRQTGHLYFQKEILSQKSFGDLGRISSQANFQLESRTEHKYTGTFEEIIKVLERRYESVPQAGFRKPAEFCQRELAYVKEKCGDSHGISKDAKIENLTDAQKLWVCLKYVEIRNKSDDPIAIAIDDIVGQAARARLRSR